MVAKLRLHLCHGMRHYSAGWQSAEIMRVCDAEYTVQQAIDAGPATGSPASSNEQSQPQYAAQMGATRMCCMDVRPCRAHVFCWTRTISQRCTVEVLGSFMPTWPVKSCKQNRCAMTGHHHVSLRTYFRDSLRVGRRS